MNIQGKRYTVFVSSTFKDLKKERAKIIRELVGINCIPLGMEYFDASDKPQIEIIKDSIDICDYYVLIVGGRYGTPFDDKQSYTMMEYEYAVGKGIPILAFIKNEESIPKSHMESDKMLLERLRAFRERISKNRVCCFWSKSEELVLYASRSLMKEMVNSPRPGWKRCKEKRKNNSMSDSIIIDYLKLCKYFRDSDIWLDTRAIEKYKKNKKYTWEDSPMLLLYDSVFHACIILEDIENGGVDISSQIVDINHIAGQIWYAIDCRMDVKEMTADSAIKVPSKITSRLIKHYKFDKSVEINRGFLRDVSGEVWEELGGDI